ncbi:uncharacterized protein LOC126997327 isoform X2 [Eriocheir sinensis]|uniref:uncharacterized protein LOC126997327 isoform X2 n=1 Tax=Eriocheir sinensis TaxID=95602 RepID=UPI0021C6723F|nr:uncharacterized protein LOC126997327 isoform X2 [Eriocheir sinensis]
MSRSEEYLPTAPSPRSWTPSPPYGLDRKHAKGIAARNFSRHPYENAGQVKSKTINGYTSRLERKGNMQRHIQSNTSSYHPGYNTLASDTWSMRPAYSSSSSRHTLRSSRQHPNEADDPTFRKTCYEKHRRTRWRRAPLLPKKSDNYSRNRREHSPLDFNLSNRNYWTGNTEQDAEPPDACSSYRGSPHARLRMAKLLPYQQHHHRLGPFARHHLESFQSPASSDLPECPRKTKPDIYSKYRRSVTPETLRNTVEEEQDMSLTYPVPTNSITSAKPRRLWHKSCGFKNEALSTGPCWVHHLQTPGHKNRQMEQPLSTSQQPRHGPHNVDEAHEQEVFRRIARKYGFCETCGMERSPKEHKCAQSDNRCVTGGWNECCASYPDDPTPSMSWDNLSPEPSPALTNIQPPQAMEGAAASVQTILHQDNENEAGTGCSSLAPVRGSTYTISCQSANEG